jgi:Calcineurin-like phosphoesterase
MLIGALGDIHGAFDTVGEIMTRHADVPLWVCVGDVASNDGGYFAPLSPLYWIKGNNEDFDVIAAAIAGKAPASNLHYLPNGGPYLVGPWRVAALGGTFAPSWYNTPAAALPPSRGRKVAGATLKLGKSRDDKRRHFVRDEVMACKALANIDLFLTHEAPRPFYPAGRRIDAGKTVLNDVLAAMKPRMHLFGHHHEFTDSVRQNVRSIGLDVVTKSYLLINAETFKTERLDT